MRPGSAAFRARDAVAGCTPARWATSRIVGRRAMRPAAGSPRGPSGRALPARVAGGPRGPVLRRGLALLELLARLEARRHRRARPRHDLVVLDVEQPQPALLAKGQADRAAELDELGLGEVRVHPLPERVVGVEPPGNRPGVAGP